jgi:hypothetical protein
VRAQFVGILDVAVVDVPVVPPARDLVVTLATLGLVAWAYVAWAYVASSVVNCW